MPFTAWNGMIHPLHPHALRGVLWYQAEDNWERPGEYAPLFNALIRQWRQDWNRTEDADPMPFYFVQIPNAYANGLLWPPIREAQQTALTQPATGMAVTIDIGDPGDIHPKNKQEVGHRLALIAKANLYGIPVEWRGPTLSRIEHAGDIAPGAMRIHYTHADGLHTRDNEAPTGFEIAGADRRFHRAQTRLETGKAQNAQSTVIVYSTAVQQPVAIRYAWADSPKVNLCNAAGLPALPFRTDDWPRRSGEKSTVEIAR
jgi:sialate O-acetylesterase